MTPAAMEGEKMTTLAETLGNRAKRKVGNNTYVERRDGNAVALRLHATDIITERDSLWTVNSGGWKTHTTKDRLNTWLPVRIYQDRGVWYWQTGEPFSDGDRVTFNGVVMAQASPAQAKAQAKERKRVLAFARLCADAVPLAKPGAGDCWYCLMKTQNGETLGDATGDASHIESHIDEGYVVPSLVFNALKDAGNSDVVLAAAFGEFNSWAELAKERVKRAVAKYVYRRLGMAS